MKKFPFLPVFLFVSIIVGTMSFPVKVSALTCWPQRSIDQHRCISGPLGGCLYYISACVGTDRYGLGDTPEKARNSCELLPCGGTYPALSQCANPYCYTYAEPSVCDSQSAIVECYSAPLCQAHVDIVNCEGQMSGTACTESTQDLTYGCWGPDNGTPTPTPGPGETPSPPPALCPNGACDIEETCTSCPADCGVCPTNKGTVQARAVRITASTISCDAVYASTTPVTPTTLSAAGTTPLSPQTQTDGNYVFWTNTPADTYTIQPTAPAGYVLRAACWRRTATSPVSGTGLSSSFVDIGETLSWDLGYTLGRAWSQVAGGDVYAAGALQSPVPVAAVPRVFLLPGAGGYPGVATYGTAFDFDAGSGSGATHVSSTNWLVQDPIASVDYYERMLRQFGGAPRTTRL